LLLPGLDLTRTALLAEEARRSIEDLCITHAEAPCGQVTISIGVESIIPRNGQSTADLVEAADRALYAAKRCGRNQVSSNLPSVVTISELEAPLDYELPSSLVA
jgi:diguanylate cyclase (GGDEF)-like protein